VPISIERIPPRPRRTVESIAREEALRIVRREMPEISMLPVILYAGYGKPGNEVQLANNPGTGTYNNIVTLSGASAVFPGGDVLFVVTSTLVWAMSAAPPSTSELTLVMDPVIDDTVLMYSPDRSTFAIAPAPKKGSFQITNTMLLLDNEVPASVLRGGSHFARCRVRLTAIDMGSGVIKLNNTSITVYEIKGNDRVKLMATQ
jgi:hypothetical protein